MAHFSDYFENKIVDYLRGQQLPTPPANWYIGLFTASPADAGGGTEVSGGAYARVSVSASLAAWAGTQGAGTTTASTGTGGTTTNNNVITFATPTVAWGTVTSIGIFDAITAGNLIAWMPLSANQVVGIGNTPSFAAATISLQVDN